MATTELADAVRMELARRRKSRQWLADEAGVSLSTLEKALSGRRPFSLATLVRLEEALQRPLRQGSEQPETKPLPNTAPERLGAYSRASVRWLERDYAMLRPSAGEAGSIYAHLLTISWDEASPRLRFAEGKRTDEEYTQGGEVGVSALSGHVYLITNDLGQFRLAILGRPTKDGALYGVLATLQVGRGSALMPVAMPLALLPFRDSSTASFGRVSPGGRCFESYRAHLDRVTEADYARLL